MDDAGGVIPYEHLAFPRTGLLRLVVGERLGATAGAQTNRLHAPLQKHLWAERERDKPRQGVVANTLKLYRNGAVGFIDWLDDCITRRLELHLQCGKAERRECDWLARMVALERERVLRLRANRSEPDPSRHAHFR